MLTKFIALLMCLFFIAPCNASEMCPKEINNSYKCAEYLEAKVSKKYPSLFLRHGSMLEIYLLNGRKISISNKDEGDSSIYLANSGMKCNFE